MSFHDLSPEGEIYHAYLIFSLCLLNDFFVFYAPLTVVAPLSWLRCRGTLAKAIKLKGIMAA